jgi:hypothetical protein
VVRFLFGQQLARREQRSGRNADTGGESRLAYGQCSEQNGDEESEL